MWISDWPKKLWRWLGHFSTVHMLWGIGAGAVVGVVVRGLTNLEAIWIVMLGIGVLSLVLAGLRTWVPAFPARWAALDSDVDGEAARLVSSSLQEATAEELTQSVIENRIVPIHRVPRDGIDSSIFGKSFRNCIIKGPAILATRHGVEWRECSFGVANEPDSIIWYHKTGMLQGVIVLTNCDFYRCQTVGIGLLMKEGQGQRFAEELRKSLSR